METGLRPSFVELGYTGGNIAAALPPGSIQAALEKRLVGRAASMTPEKASLVLEMVSQGITVEEIDRQGIASKSSIHAARQVSAEFQAALTEARRIGAEAKFERGLTVIQDVALDPDKDQKFLSNELRSAECQARMLVRHAESENPAAFAPKGGNVNIQVNASHVEQIDFSAYRNG